nr:MAG TPA: hypothetical protein [Caudoviricetes sp.]
MGNRMTVVWRAGRYECRRFIHDGLNRSRP